MSKIATGQRTQEDPEVDVPAVCTGRGYFSILAIKYRS